MFYLVNFDKLSGMQIISSEAHILGEVKDIEIMPSEMFSKKLPKTKYAVFTAKGKDFLKVNDYIYDEWLPKSKYKESFTFQIQLYDSKRYKGLDNDDSEIDFYIPIKWSE